MAHALFAVDIILNALNFLHTSINYLSFCRVHCLLFVHHLLNIKEFIIWVDVTGNMGNLPLIIVPAVCRENGSPFGPPDVCQTYGIAYASLSMAVWYLTTCIYYSFWLFPDKVVKNGSYMYLIKVLKLSLSWRNLLIIYMAQFVFWCAEWKKLCIVSSYYLCQIACISWYSHNKYTCIHCPVIINNYAFFFFSEELHVTFMHLYK